MSRPHALRRVALTGGIATGKSHCLRTFSSLGAPVIDADSIAHALVEPGQPALAEITRRFGSGMLKADGTLDRTALGAIVFADADARADLESILHPRVYVKLASWFDDLAAGNGRTPRVAIADIPLLYETGYSADFDRVVVAACPPEQQLERVMKRDGLSEADARLRIAAQLPIADKIARADYVIDTSGTTGQTDKQIEKIWKQLKRQTED